MLYVVPAALPADYAWKIRGAAVTDIVWAGARFNAEGKLQNVPAEALREGTSPENATPLLLVGLTSVRAGVAVLTQPEIRSASIVSLQRLLQKYRHLKGIQLDFEYLPPQHAEAFIAYIKSLRRALPANAGVQAAVFPPVGMPASWSAFHKLPELAAVADGIVVMLYDYHRQGTEPGCVSGIAWIGENARVLAALPRGKMWLGAPLYGYRFREKKATTISHGGFEKIVARETAADGCRVKANESAVAYYPGEDLYARYDALARKTGLAGIAYWRAGLEK